MLAAKYILKGEKNFKKVKNEGRVYQASDFGVCVLKKNSEETSRFGVIVSKKVDKLAVHRNRVKRSITESIRRNIGDIETGYDMVFLVKKSLMKESTESIMNKVQKWIRKTEL